jgi:hypothetical protein
MWNSAALGAPFEQCDSGFERAMDTSMQHRFAGQAMVLVQQMFSRWHVRCNGRLLTTMLWSPLTLALVTSSARSPAKHCGLQTCGADVWSRPTARSQALLLPVCFRRFVTMWTCHNSLSCGVFCTCNHVREQVAAHSLRRAEASTCFKCCVSMYTTLYCRCAYQPCIACAQRMWCHAAFAVPAALMHGGEWP